MSQLKRKETEFERFASMAGIKRKREGEAEWSEVGSDLLECVMRRLCFVDILRMKRACRWWFSVGESYTSSPSYRPCFQTPWLLIPSPEEEEEEEDGDKVERKSNSSLCFFNLDEKKAYRDVCLCREVYEGRCVGSSHGWLFLLDKTANLSLFNPFSGARIQVEGSLKVGRSEEEEELFDVDAYTADGTKYKKYKGGRAFILKAILMMSDIGKKKINKDKDGVVLIYRGGEKLAFCMFNDGRFMDLDGAHESYNDVICYGNLVCAISQLYGFVEVWDFSTTGSSPSPTKVMDICSSLPLKKAREFLTTTRQVCCSYHFYLVESCGELLSVVRMVSEFMDVDEHENGKDNQPKKISLYKTLMFYVFRVDLHHKILVEMESLGDQVLFLGGNNSISLRVEDCPGCIKDSIYFTDSYWERADEDDSYGGHDMGYYNLKDRCVKPFYDAPHCYNMKPTPFWVLPNPW